MSNDLKVQKLSTEEIVGPKLFPLRLSWSSDVFLTSSVSDGTHLGERLVSEN